MSLEARRICELVREFSMVSGARGGPLGDIMDRGPEDQAPGDSASRQGAGKEFGEAAAFGGDRTSIPAQRIQGGRRQAESKAACGSRYN